MRLFSLSTLLFVAAIFSGCKNNTQEALDIIENAKKGVKPSNDEVRIVYEQLNKEGSTLSLSEVEELLSIHVAMKHETEPSKLQELYDRLKVLVQRLKK